MAVTPRATALVLVDIEQALDAIDHAARAGLTDGERLRLVEAARRAGRRIDALVATLVGEAERADSAMTARRTPLPTLLAATATTKHEAPGLVRAGRTLSAHPLVEHAALAGHVSLAQAASIDKVLTGLPRTLTDTQKHAAERALLARTIGRSAEQVARLGPEVLAEVAPDLVATRSGTLEAQARRARQRRAFSFWHEDGSTFFRGNLPTVDAAPLLKALDVALEVDRRATRHHADHRTPDQKRADAFLATVSNGITPPAGSPTQTQPPPARVVVLIDHAALASGAEGAGLLEGRDPLAPGDLRRLCCDAELIPAVLGSNSEVLDVGRGTRLATSEQRLALAIRDGGCVFPHCDLGPDRCQAHHLTPWWAGGRSDLDEMCLLCPTHHALVEPRGPTGQPRSDQWRIQLDPTTRKPTCVPPRE